MKEHDEIDEFFRNTFEDFRPDASHISDAGVFGFLKAKAAAKTTLLSKLGVSSYIAITTVTVATAVTTAVWYSSDDTTSKNAGNSQAVKPVIQESVASVDDSLPINDQTDKQTHNLVVTYPGSASDESPVIQGKRSASEKTTVKNGAYNQAPVIPNKKAILANPKKNNKTEPVYTSSETYARTIEDYLAEKFPVPVHFADPEAATPAEQNTSGIKASKMLVTNKVISGENDSVAETEEAIIYTEVVLPVDVSGQVNPSVNNADVQTRGNRNDSLQLAESGAVQEQATASANQLNTGIPVIHQKPIWPNHRVGLNAGSGFAPLSNAGGGMYTNSPVLGYPQNDILSGSVQNELLLALNYDYRLPDNIAFQAGLQYQTGGWDVTESWQFYNLYEDPDTSYYFLDTVDVYHQKVSFTAIGLSLATGYDFLFTDHWMLAFRMGLSGKHYRSESNEEDLLNYLSYKSERNAFVLSAFGRVEALYRFNKIGISLGISVNGRSSMTRSLDYAALYNNVSYGVDGGLHYFLGK